MPREARERLWRAWQDFFLAEAALGAVFANKSGFFLKAFIFGNLFPFLVIFGHFGHFWSFLALLKHLLGNMFIFLGFLSKSKEWCFFQGFHVW